MTEPPGRLRRWALLLLGVAASTLLLGLYARIEVPWIALGWIALVPWLFVLDRAGSRRETLLGGLALSVGFLVAVCGWFPASVQDYTGAPRLMCWLVVLGLSPILEPQFITFALARHLAQRAVPVGERAWLRTALVGALAYVGTEWLWPKLFADTLGHGLYASVLLRQGADLAGAHGLTLILLLSNDCALAAARALASRSRPDARRALAPAALLAALVLGCFGYGAFRTWQVREHTRPDGGLVVGLVQANITHYDRLAAEKGTFEVVKQVLETHYALSDELLRRAKTDLLVWPETIYPTTFGTPKSDEGGDFDHEIAAFVTQRQVPLIFGSYDVEQKHEFNAAMLLGPSLGGKLEYISYRKTKLFPLTEWVPDLLDFRAFRQLFPWTGTWKRGPGPQALSFQLRGRRPITLAPLICYEDVFPGYVAQAVRQGAELIVTMSNDSWFSGTPEPRSHLLLAAFRSIETRLPQVRATNSGISALITPTGEIVAQTQDNQRAAVNVTVPGMERLPTLFVAWGDWLGPTALVAAAGLLLAPLLGRASRKRSQAKRT